MNYNDIIEAALKEGVGFEQIAADFSKALNEKQNEVKADEDREDFIDTLIEHIDYWWNSTDNENALLVAADLATYAAADTHENWDADRLKQFVNDAYEQLQALVSLYEMEDEGDPFARTLRKGLDICGSKSKEEKKETAAPIGKAEDKDTESLMNFLLRLGL